MASPQSEAARVLGQRVRNARTALGVSQIEVWQRSGIHFTNIGKIERGEANPALHTLIRLADALQVDVADLVQGLTVADLPAEDQARVLPIENFAPGATKRRKI